MFQDLHCLTESQLHTRLVALTGEFLDQTDAHAPHIRTCRGGDNIGHRLRDRGGVTGIVASDDRVQQSGVHDRAGTWSRLVKARCESNESIAGHPAVGRLDPHRAGHGCRLPDGSARVRADGQRRFECG